MNPPPTQLRLADIIDENRQRKDYGKIDEFGQQLKEEGLIHPIIVVATTSGSYALLAGGRRRAALLSAGYEFVYHGTSCEKDRPGYLLASELSDSKKQELELVENIRRKQMDWKETCRGIYRIHRARQRESAIAGQKWGQRETAELFGYDSHASVNYPILIGGLLDSNPENEFWKYDSLKAVVNELQLREINRIEASLAKESVESYSQVEPLKTQDIFGDSTPTPVDPQSDIIVLRQRASGKGYLYLTQDEARTLYLSNSLNPPEEFEAYYNEKLASLQSDLTLTISNRLFKGNSIVFMNDPSNKERFDHILTDIPYGIDIEMMQQASHALKDAATIKEEHDVEYNLQLIKDFFPAAYHCTKPNAYVVTWCDAWLFRYMADIAIESGFKVCRWPYHWVKTYRGSNGAAQFNFTKCTEIAIICRKGSATLANPTGPNNYVLAGSSDDDICQLVDHPFAKPQAVWQPLIEALTLENQEILEPFAGKGSGVLSLLRNKRKVTAVELNDSHFNGLLENVKGHYLAINPNFKFI